MPSVLLHVCCGPCSLMPITVLKEEGLAVTAWFYNPNIHPQEEYDLRRQAMAEAGEKMGVPVWWKPDFQQQKTVRPATWVQALGENRQEGTRCQVCYRARLEPAAILAATHGFAGFSTSLLYSRYQQHDAIRKAGEDAARMAGSVFVYRDFRPYWQQGINLSKQLGLYRQKWCGCILSKAEAEAQRLAKKVSKVSQSANNSSI